ncbi:hypothetical protein JCM8547_003286 [Rhodosporidiobolus lusitaniae]
MPISHKDGGQRSAINPSDRPRIELEADKSVLDLLRDLNFPEPDADELVQLAKSRVVAFLEYGRKHRLFLAHKSWKICAEPGTVSRKPGDPNDWSRSFHLVFAPMPEKGLAKTGYDSYGRHALRARYNGQLGLPTMAKRRENELGRRKEDDFFVELTCYPSENNPLWHAITTTEEIRQHNWRQDDGRRKQRRTHSEQRRYLDKWEEEPSPSLPPQYAHTSTVWRWTSFFDGRLRQVAQHVDPKQPWDSDVEWFLPVDMANPFFTQAATLLEHKTQAKQVFDVVFVENEHEVFKKRLEAVHVKYHPLPRLPGVGRPVVVRPQGKSRYAGRTGGGGGSDAFGVTYAWNANTHGGGGGLSSGGGGGGDGGFDLDCTIS